MNIQEIDHLTEHFYQCISFNKDHYPNFDKLQELFYGVGKMINNNFDQPIDFTVQSFAQTIMAQIEAGNATFYAQQEISDVTEVFGSIAQRISVYEYGSSEDPDHKWKRGVNYIQYIYTQNKWLITSMVWQDEKEEIKIPESYLL